MSCYPYHSEEDRQRAIKQLTDEYVHLPQFDATSKFFLLPPSTKTAQEIGAKVPRTEFHVDPKTTGKGFATANGFARTEAFSSCQNPSGKACSGKPSLFEEEKAAEDCDCRRSTMSIHHIVKLLAVADELAKQIERDRQPWEVRPCWRDSLIQAHREATQAFRGLLGQMENNEP